MRALLSTNTLRPWAYVHPINVYFEYDECIQTLVPLAVLLGIIVVLVLLGHLAHFLETLRIFSPAIRWMKLILSARISKTQYSISDALYMFIWFTGLLAVVNAGDFPRQTGYLIVANMTVLLLPIYRIQKFSKITGSAYTVAVRHHRNIGKVILILCLIHMFGYCKQWSDQGVLPSEMFSKPKNTWGSISAIIMIVMVALSVNFVRRVAWEVFKYSHFIGFTLFWVAACFHHPQSLTYTFIPLVLYALDRLWSLLWVAKAGAVVFQASIPSESTTLVLSAPTAEGAPRCSKPGQYFFLATSAGIDRGTWHPITAASAPCQDELKFFISFHGKGQWSDRIAAVASSEGRILMRVDGPYGNVDIDYAKYNRVVFVAGGIGITPILATMSQLGHGDKGSVSEVILIWSVRSLSLFQYFRKDLRKLRKTLPGFSVAVHLTSASAEIELVEMGKAKGVKFGRPKIDQIWYEMASQEKQVPRTAVFACGPQSLVHSVWDQCTLRSSSSNFFEFHKETFLL